MIEGKVEIYLSHKEPDKNLLWLRPYLDKDGYELLYFGANGWTPLCCRYDQEVNPIISDGPASTIIDGDVLVEIPSKCTGASTIYEITSPSFGNQEPPCGCSDVTIKQM